VGNIAGCDELRGVCVEGGGSDSGGGVAGV